AAATAITVSLVLFAWRASDFSGRGPPALAAQKFDASAVPLVDDNARRVLARYPSRPNHKALAITGQGLAVADGQPTAEAARADALRRCTARTGRQCRLY